MFVYVCVCVSVCFSHNISRKETQTGVVLGLWVRRVDHTEKKNNVAFGGGRRSNEAPKPCYYIISKNELGKSPTEYMGVL